MVWLLSQEEGAIPAIAMHLNRRCKASWYAGGMSLSIRHGIPSCPATLWLGVRRKTSCMMARVIHPEIIGVEAAGVGWVWPSQGIGPPGGAWGPEIGPQFPSV